MAKQKVSKASKRRLITFGTLSFFVICYFFNNLFNYTIDISKLSTQQKNLEDKLTVLQSNEKQLKNEIQKLKDPEYVARYARENYLYSKDGEYIIKLNPIEEVTISKDYNLKTNDYIIFSIILGLFIFIIIILMKRNINKKAATA